MTIFEYDFSFDGLLSTIFEIYERKQEAVTIIRSGADRGDLFSEHYLVFTDEAKAERVLRKIEVLLGKDGVSLLWQCWLSEITGIENTMLAVVRYAIGTGKNILSDFGNEHVLRLRQVVKMVSRERHRMKAFVRFQLTKDGIYFSVVEPDFNVLPLIIRHFKDRYADQQWIIYDTRRDYGIYYDLKTVDFVDFQFVSGINPQQLDSGILNEEEALYQNLWKDYFKSTNIASRKNTKLHLQHVPKRYWKYLTEKKL